MQTDDFPAPGAHPPFQEHEVANPANPRRLQEAIPDDPRLLTRLHGKHIISARHFSHELLAQLLRRAASYELGELGQQPSVACKVMGCLFMDHARSQTRLSFNRAWLCLGGSFLNIERTISQILPNRNPPDEIAELCNSFSDLALIRTPDHATLAAMLEYFRIPVVSAGTGSDENPTHGLADLYTLFKWRPDLVRREIAAARPLQIGIVGNPSETPTIGSFLYALSRFPHAVERIVLLDRLAQPFSTGQREELERAGLRIETVMEVYPHETIMESFRKLVPDLDMIYVHTLQKPQASRMDLLEFKANLKPHALILNPDRQFPEYSDMINNSSHNGFFTQARGSVFLRMALLAAVMGR